MKMFAKLKRTLAGVLAMVMLTATLTACGGGGGGGNGGASSSSGSNSTGTASSSSSTSGSLTDVSSTPDSNMGGAANTANTLYTNSRTRAVAEKYSSKPVTVDIDMVSNTSDGTTKINIVMTKNGTDYYHKITSKEASESELQDSGYETWIKNGTCYYCSGQTSKLLGESDKIILELTSEENDFYWDNYPTTSILNDPDVWEAIYPVANYISGTFVALGMQKAPSSFTDGKTYYAEQADYMTMDGLKFRATYYYDGANLAYSSTYNLSSGEITNAKYNSISPTFDSSKMTVGGNGYKIVGLEDFTVKLLTAITTIDPSKPTGNDSSVKSVLSDTCNTWILYLRSIKNPSAETTKWLTYWGNL